MPETTVEYDARRAETLAQLVLTRRRDLEVTSLRDHGDLGLDFLVRVGRSIEQGIAATFGVQVKGTAEPLPDDLVATRFLNQRWKQRASTGLFLFPIVVLLFSMENDQGYWAWLLEPSVSKEREPALSRVSHLDASKIGNKSIFTIADKVEEWSKAMVESIVKHESAR